MKKSFLYFCLLLVISFVFSSCHSDRSRILVSAYSMVDSLPDSTLALLRKVDCDNLSAKDMAEYSLLFTMAQDKSGLDVDNDSLIRIAYDWFQQHQDDSLYAKCLYYMGKYYMLNDSTEQAISLLTQSSQKSNKIGDLKTESMALEKLSKVYQVVEPEKSLVFSKKALETYARYPYATLKNRIYLNLNYSEALLACEITRKSVDVALSILPKTLVLKDSVVLADVYQDLANSYLYLGYKDSCLFYAKKTYDLQPIKNMSCRLMLADAYQEADSVRQCLALLESLKPTLSTEKYVCFQICSQASIKMQDYEKSKMYMDSAYSCIENMYAEAVKGKADYYSSVLKKEKQKSEFKGRAEMQSYLLLLVIILALLVIVFLLYVYKNSRNKAQKEIIFEKRQAEMKVRHEHELAMIEKNLSEQYHQKELSRKEVQLSIMRSYLMKLVTAVEKLNSIKTGTGKHVVLTEKDWKEIAAFLDSTENMFVTRLKTRFPNLSEGDLHLMMLLRLKMPQKVLASLYCITEKAVKQKLFLYKEKVGINGQNISLREYMETF
jgi:tetratricopeptide (TPR) repeat protein